MEDTNSILLPYILDTLSQKPGWRDSYDNLYNELEEVLSSANGVGNIRKAIQKALDLGESLGIFSLTNETIRLLFNFHTNAKNSRASDVMANHDDDFDDDEVSESEHCDSPQRKHNHLTIEDSEEIVKQPTRPRRKALNMLPHAQSKRGRNRSHGSRRKSSRQGSRQGSRRRHSSSKRGSSRRRSRSTQG